MRDDRRIGLTGLGREDARFQPVMSVYVYLDDVPEEDGGALYFPRGLPAPVAVQPQKALAAVFYSALEDGSVDRSAAHGDGPLNAGEAWVLRLRVYATPRPFARRALLPAALWVLGGAPSVLTAQRTADFFLRIFGPAKADAAIDAALYALAALLLLPILLVAFYVAKKVEEARAPPKREHLSDCEQVGR